MIRMIARSTLYPRGFTLMEVLLVVAILGVIASLVVPQLAGRQEQASVDASRLSATGIEQALRLYALDHGGKLPSAAEGLQVLVEPVKQDPRWRGPYLDTLPVDAWGQPFQFEVVAQRGGRGTAVIRSVGPDGLANTDDDITNAKSK